MKLFTAVAVCFVLMGYLPYMAVATTAALLFGSEGGVLCATELAAEQQAGMLCAVGAEHRCHRLLHPKDIAPRLT